MSIRFKASRAASPSTVPSPSTTAKSRTRLSSRLATRGVPRLHFASSSAPSSVQGWPRMPALRRMMRASSSGL